MTAILSRFIFRIILLSGIVVGVLKGQEARNKWVTKKKMKYEAKRADQTKSGQDGSLVALDDFEMSTYHS